MCLLDACRFVVRNDQFNVRLTTGGAAITSKAVQWF
jgi:hypothetical protein